MIFQQILKAIDDNLFAFIILCFAIGWAIRVIVLKKDPNAEYYDLRDELIKFEHWKRERPEISDKKTEVIVDQYLDEN